MSDNQTPDANGWRTIDDGAPKDGTRILVWCHGGMHIAQWLPVWHPENMRWVSRLFTRNDRDTQSVELGPIDDQFQISVGWTGPTHWQPLPAPPSDVT